MSLDYGIKKNIDWLSNDAGNDWPTRKVGWLYSVWVGLGAIPAIRGPIGAQDCLYIATVYSFLGADKAAISWLCAGQAHREDIVSSFNNNRDACLKYIKDTYLDKAIARWGAVYSTFSSGNQFQRSTIISDKFSDQIKNREGGYYPPLPPDPPPIVYPTDLRGDGASGGGRNK